MSVTASSAWVATALCGLVIQSGAATLTVGTNINATRLTGNQTETTIAVNPTNALNLFVAVNNGTFPTPGLFRYTTNGGLTWSNSDVSALPAACCDEASAWDDFGNLFITYLTTIGSTAVVGVSTNGGGSFRLLFQSTNGIDQPSIAVGPGGAVAPGSVWITFAGPSGLTVHGAPVFGPGHFGAFGPEQIAPGLGGSFGDLAIGPNGELLVAYQGTALSVNLDPDGLGPAGFGPEIVATATLVGSFLAIPAQPKRKIDAEAGLAWDRSPGPHRGRLHLVYTDRPTTTSSDTDIYARHSDDLGTSWSAPVRVNDDPAGKSQFLPRLALDQTTGNLAVSFYDCRESAGNNTVQVWAAASLDGGAAFVPNVKVSAGTSSALVVAVSTSNFDFGDYTGLTFHGDVFYPCWGDNSNSTGDNPDGTLHPLDAYLAAVRVPPTASPLTILRTPTNAVLISWVKLSSGFVLQQKSSLSTTNWSEVTNAVQTVGAQSRVLLPFSGANGFFRLFHP